ncbi:hypothetical protein L1987_71877 [Smallanthus sonchifolius]|uniref:Uncharacterized protein n=1 Tax=Smallanthus sonchifolius TaxID=185202 RepID=A0ACB9ASU9_9ASTR|nr:hypothetical protein L1987_71877 [Smallanthus sonchifolius]
MYTNIRTILNSTRSMMKAMSLPQNLIEYDGKHSPSYIQEQPPMDKKQFVGYIKMYFKLLTPSLMQSNMIFLRKNFEPATKFLPSKFNDLRL